MKKLLALILTLTMVFTMSISAFADEGSTTSDPFTALTSFNVRVCDNSEGTARGFSCTSDSGLFTLNSDTQVLLYSGDKLLSTTTAKSTSSHLGSGVGSIFVAWTGDVGNASGTWATTMNATIVKKSEKPNKMVLKSGTYTKTIDFVLDEVGGESFISLSNVQPDFKVIHADSTEVACTTFAQALSEATTAGDIIDMCGSTVDVNGAIEINRDITIKNGKFDLDGFVLPNGNGIFDVNANATFENVTVFGENYSSAYSVMFARSGKTVTLNNCTFTLTNELPLSDDDLVRGEIGGVFKSNASEGKFVINGGTYTLTDTVRCFVETVVAIDGATITAENTTPSSEHFFRNVSGTINNSIITATDFETGIKNTDGKTLTVSGGTQVTFTGMTKDVNLEANKTVNGQKDSYLVVESGSTVPMTNSAVEAKIGNTYYGTFADALKKATATDTITLVKNVTFWQISTTCLTNAKEIDLNDKVLTLSGEDNNFGNATIKNGTLDLTATTINGQSLIWCCNENSTTKFEGVTINVVNLNQDDITAISSNYGGTFEFKNCVINVKPTGDRTDFTAFVAIYGKGDVVFEDCDINMNNTQAKLFHCSNDNPGNGDIVLTIKGSTTIDADIYGNGIYVDHDSTTIKVETTDDNGNLKAPVINIKANKRSETDRARYGITLAENTVYTVADGAVVNATVYRTPSETNIADEIAVKFVDVTENEGEKVYDIYVETATDKTINGLTALELALKLDTTEGSFVTTVTGPQGTPAMVRDGMYLFSYDGVAKSSETGSNFKIGQVKLVGNGKFTLSIDDTKVNFANTTSFDGENTDVKYVAGATTGKTLDISDRIENVTVKAPSRNLTINIDFKHGVNSQVKDYQKMTVTLTNITNSAETATVIELGSDGNKAINNNAVSITEELAYNATYNVEIKGAGYRTVNYQVIMDDNKELKFWNNFKNTAEEVLSGDGMAVNTTFLAGDIIADGKINIYDLSAVVSYFGMKHLTSDVDAYAKYAQYDLNRDGKINSEDVAYVLLSWNK